MATIADLKVSIGADIADLQKGIGKVESQLKSFGTSMTNMGKTLSTRVTAPLTALGTAAVAAFGQQEQAELRLRAALNANGRAVDSLFNKYADFASQMQATTVVGDETTIEMLAQAEALGLTGDAAERAVRNSIAMQSAFGVNAQSALRYTAALEQGNATMLTRYIPTLREIDDESERAAEAQRVLGKAFSAAEAEAQSTLGGFQQYKNALGDAFEDIGESIVEAFNINEIVQNSIKRVESFRKAFASMSDDAKRRIVLITGAIAGIGPALIGIGVTVSALGVAFGALVSPIGLAVAAIAGLAAGVLYVWDNWKAIKERISDLSWWRNMTISMVQMLNQVFVRAFDGFNQLLQLVGGSGFANPFTAVNNGLESLKAETKEYEHQFGSFVDAIKNGASAITGIDLSSIFSAPSGEESAFKTASVEAKTFSNGIRQINQDLLQTVPVVEVVRASVRDMTNATNFARSIADQFTQSFGAGMANVVVQAESLVDALKNIGKLLLSSAIQKGIGALLTGGLGGGGFFGSGGGLFGKIFGLAQGGLAFGPTMAVVGDNKGARSNPEVIAPLDKLQSMMGSNTQKVVVEGQLRGTDIFLSNQRAGTRFNR